MSTFTLAISCLTTSNLLWFMFRYLVKHYYRYVCEGFWMRLAWVNRLSKADCVPQCEWVLSNSSEAWVEQEGGYWRILYFQAETLAFFCTWTRKLTPSALLVLRSSDLNGVVEKMVITWQKLRELRLISEVEAGKCRVGNCDGNLENEDRCHFK